MSEPNEASETRPSATDHPDQLVRFRLGDEYFGVGVLKVREIIRRVEITRVPRAPEFVEGVVNLRGQVIPVVDLRHRFGLGGEGEEREERIVVTELSDQVVGFLVDGVQDVVDVPEMHVDPPPELTTSIGERYITGVARLDEELLMLLDLEDVLSEDEEEQLSQVSDDRQENPSNQ